MSKFKVGDKVIHLAYGEGVVIDDHTTAIALRGGSYRCSDTDLALVPDTVMVEMRRADVEHFSAHRYDTIRFTELNQACKTALEKERANG